MPGTGPTNFTCLTLNLQMALSLEVGAVMHTHSNFSEQEMEAHRVVNSYQGGGGSGQWQAGGSSRRVAVY